MDDEVIIVGAGIGGLTLALALHQSKIPCRIFESALAIKPIGVGINLLPHATKELAALGLEPDLARAAITGALANVEINLSSLKDASFATDVRSTVRRIQG